MRFPILDITVMALITGLASASTDVSTCTSSGFAIPDGGSGGQSATMEVAAAENPLVVVGARLELEIEHPWVGDLVVRLVAPSDAATLTLVNRPGQVPFGFPGPFGCGGDDILASLEDGASVALSEACTTTETPVFAGSLRPQVPLAGLIGVDPVGTWRIEIADLQSGDAGSFISACLRLEVANDCDRDGVPDECQSCPGDLDGDGIIGGSDLSVLLGAWGTAEPLADLDGNGIVSGSDLSVLLGNWGACS